MTKANLSDQGASKRMPYHLDMLRNRTTNRSEAVEAAGLPGPDPPATDGDVAYRRIRTYIVFGRLAPGQKLTLERMREAYAASVSTLREIFNRLSSEGLIV